MSASLIGRLAAVAASAVAVALLAAGGANAAPAASCNLGPGGSIHHVIYIQYDNTHLMRDNPNVPSDLEQVPALKNYLTGNGTLLSNDHTILISHTAGGIVSALTGLYPDRNGIAVANSYGVFKPDGSIDSASAPAFTYWTDQATTNDTLPNLITNGQKNTPAPWVPFTRAGCTTGAFSIANMELENTATTASGDITKVFGNGSPEFNFAKSAAPSAEKTTDFEGIAIHCSQADSAAGTLCGSAHGGKADVLPDEPGGYTGFNALFGAPYANQVVDQPGGFQASTADANGTATGYNDLAPAVDDVFDFSHTATPSTCSVAPDPGPCPATKPIGSGGFNGFPGFSPTAAQTLGYTAAMQESGIPITFAYIEDSHDDQEPGVGACPASGVTNGPGSACYVQQLKEQNTAYEAFFNRLAADGINKSNTMFVFTVDEGDHFAGGAPTNAGSCDGVTVACNYATGITGPGSVGEIDANLNQLVPKEFPSDTTPFSIHFDDAPTVYVPNSPNGPPGPTNPAVRQLERDMNSATIVNPRTGNVDPVTQHIADPVTQSILHEQNTDPLRTPSFTLFGNDDYFFQSSCPPGSTATDPGCPAVGNGFAWNHGDDNPVIASTWIGMVGPDVQNLGQTGSVWTDHTDLRPTLLAALGLSDDYASDGDVVSQVLAPSALPPTLDSHVASYQALEAVQKQLDAPFGRFGHDAETVSTTAVATTSPSTYDAWDAKLAACQSTRNALDAQIQSRLTAAAAGTATLDDPTATTLAGQGTALMNGMDALAGDNSPPALDPCNITSVTGTVTDSAGAPVANICVYPYDATTGIRTADAAACTDASGAYRLTLAAAGSYNLVFFDASGTYVTQWYNGAPFEGGATPVTVAAGMSTTGINAVLASSAGSATGISGTVTNAAGNGVANICVYPFGSTTTNRTSDPAACTDASGKYTLPLAAAGSYNLVFFDASGNYTTQWYKDAAFEGAATPVSVTAGSTTPGINAVLASSTAITGTVTNAAGAGIPNICVYPFDSTTTNRTADPAACTDASGKYTLSVPAGSYNLVFFDATGTYATRWYNGAPFESGATPVTATAGATTSGIDATLPLS